ncbi:MULTISPECIES: hypothetical protein [unclassified Campylobacter]|uniref:hypothetical protein n=1 Tax=unclassified Campylobacter TaxID=2593542 RepID=UPI003D33BC57
MKFLKILSFLTFVGLLYAEPISKVPSLDENFTFAQGCFIEGKFDEAKVIWQRNCDLLDHGASCRQVGAMFLEQNNKCKWQKISCKNMRVKR